MQFPSKNQKTDQDQPLDFGAGFGLNLSIEDDDLLSSLLKDSAIQPEVKPTFDLSVLRKHRVATAKRTFNYWSPAILGAAIAGMAAVSLLQILTAPSQRPYINLPRDSTAKNDVVAGPTSFHLPSESRSRIGR